VTVADLFFGWWSWLGKHSSDIWNIVPLCLCGLCGGNLIFARLKTRSDLWLSWKQFFFEHLLIGLEWGFTLSTSILDIIPSLYTRV
jgi:hypothetical protein